MPGIHRENSGLPVPFFSDLFSISLRGMVPMQEFEEIITESAAGDEVSVIDFGC